MGIALPFFLIKGGFTMEKLNEPLNAQERFLYAIAVRLEAIIEQNNSIIEVLANEKNVAITSTKVENTPVKEEVVAEEKPKQTTRRTRKKVE